jgi:hypothetical protein
VVTQAELAEYRRLKETAELANAAVALARESLITAHEQNLGVEPGPMRLKVETRSSRTFSYEAMVDVVGRVMADLVKGLLPAKSSTVVTVTAP